MKRGPIKVQRFLRVGGLIVPLLVAACIAKAPDKSGNKKFEGYASWSEGGPLPIELGVLRRDVEQHESWGRLRKAACPRRILDRHEEMDRYPTISLLHGLKYATVTDDTSHGLYEKVIELTPLGRQELINDLQEQPEKYIFTVARREYVPELRVIYERAPKREDHLFVTFWWRWKPLNRLGLGLNLRPLFRNRDEHQGRAKYEKKAEGWKLYELWLEDDAKDYLHRVARDRSTGILPAPVGGLVVHPSAAASQVR